MNPVSTSLLGMAEFLFKLIIAMFLLRMAAIKLHDHPAGQGLAVVVS